MPSTYARTFVSIEAPSVANCTEDKPHHWRVDAMWDCPEDSELNRVKEECKLCGAIRYSPRYFEDSWSRSIPLHKKKTKKQKAV